MRVSTSSLLAAFAISLLALAITQAAEPELSVLAAPSVSELPEAFTGLWAGCSASLVGEFLGGYDGISRKGSEIPSNIPSVIRWLPVKGYVVW
jgi:hypothetical protein